MAENFSNLMKDVTINKKLNAVQVRLTQRAPQQEFKNMGPKRQLADIFKVLKDSLQNCPSKVREKLRHSQINKS